MRCMWKIDRVRDSKCLAHVNIDDEMHGNAVTLTFRNIAARLHVRCDPWGHYITFINIYWVIVRCSELNCISESNWMFEQCSWTIWSNRAANVSIKCLWYIYLVHAASNVCHLDVLFRRYCSNLFDCIGKNYQCLWKFFWIIICSYDKQVVPASVYCDTMLWS